MALNKCWKKTPYAVYIQRDNYWHRQDEIIKWCYSNLGPFDEKWSYYTIFGSAEFWFENKDDLIRFKLVMT